jgi:hypothetical protein
MLMLKCSRTIAAPPRRVFEVATDLRSAVGRVRAITKMEVLTEGPVRKGTRFRETRTMFGRPATEEMEITAFEPPRGFTMECANHGCRYEMEFRLEPKGTSTELEMMFRVQALTFVAKVMSTLMRPLGKRMVGECAKDLDDIARVAEGRA